MSKHGVEDFFVSLGWQPLSFVKYYKTPGHFLQPLIRLADFTLFRVKLAFQIGVRGNKNMTLFVPYIVYVLRHRLCCQNYYSIFVNSLSPFLYLSLPLVTSWIVRTNNQSLFLYLATYWYAQKRLPSTTRQNYVPTFGHQSCFFLFCRYDWFEGFSLIISEFSKGF